MTNASSRPAHDLAPRAYWCLRETARSFRAPIKMGRESGIIDPRLERIGKFLDSRPADVIPWIRPYTEILQNIPPGQHRYHNMSDEERSAFREREYPYVIGLLDALKTEHGVDLTDSILPQEIGYPNLSRMFLNELHRVSGIGLRMVSLVTDEISFGTRAIDLAFELGREFANRKVLAVLGQANNLTDAFSRGITENSGAVIGIFDERKPQTNVSMQIIADIGRLRAAVVGRASRALIKIGGQEYFRDVFPDLRQPHGRPGNESFAFGARLIAKNEFIPVLDVTSDDGDVIPRICRWVDNILGDETDGEKYGLLAKHVLFPVSVIGSANMDFRVHGFDLKASSKHLGELLSENGYLVINGAGTGSMLQVAVGMAKNNKSVSVGIVPDSYYTASNHSIDIPLVTGIGLDRDCIVAQSGRIVIALPGSFGTKDEIRLARDAELPIINFHSLIPRNSEYSGLYHAETAEDVVHIANTLRVR